MMKFSWWENFQHEHENFRPTIVDCMDCEILFRLKVVSTKNLFLLDGELLTMLRDYSAYEAHFIQACRVVCLTPQEPCLEQNMSIRV